MGWIRIAVGMDDDLKVHILADRLGCPVASVVGHLVLLLSRFPDHAPEGNLARIPASMVERWAAWEGERGRFDAAFRETFLVDGIWAAWEKHNGKALAKLERDRERQRLEREARADNLAKLAGVSRDGRAFVAGTNERTYERTTNGGGRKRPLNGNGTDHYAPGHNPAEPLAPPFCEECGDGVAVQPEGSKRFVQVHASTCSHR